MSHNDSHILSPGLSGSSGEPSPTVDDVIGSQETPAQSVTEGDALAPLKATLERAHDLPPGTIDERLAENEKELEPTPFTVVGDYIVVEVIERTNVTDSGIILAGDTSTKERPSDVVVVGAGPAAGVWPKSSFDQGALRPLRFGDVLIVQRHQMVGLTLGDDGRSLYVLQPPAVIGIVE